MTAAGGDARLCWCSGLSGVDCANPASFPFDAGLLRVTGPAAGQAHRCWKGRPCDLPPLNGTGLAADDEYRVYT